MTNAKGCCLNIGTKILGRLNIPPKEHMPVANITNVNSLFHHETILTFDFIIKTVYMHSVVPPTSVCSLMMRIICAYALFYVYISAQCSTNTTPASDN